jgi:hypothetical protein
MGSFYYYFSLISSSIKIISFSPYWFVCLRQLTPSHNKVFTLTGAVDPSYHPRCSPVLYA